MSATDHIMKQNITRLWFQGKYLQLGILGAVSVLILLVPERYADAADGDAHNPTNAADVIGVHGDTASVEYGNAPFVVAVMKQARLACTGLLISTLYVGVACHCIASILGIGRPGLNGVALKEYDFVAGVKFANELVLANMTPHARKPKALLTHPYCENEPPYVYDIGIAVMERPFQTIRDTVEVYDLFRTDSREFVTSLAELFSRKNPQEVPDCVYSGWRIGTPWTKSELLQVKMVNFRTSECKNIWEAWVPNFPKDFDFSRYGQFCIVTHNVLDDDIDLPTDGPFICENLYVGYVIYGPEERLPSRKLPIVTQSLAVILDWVKDDPYFEGIGCFGTNSNCRDDEESPDQASVAMNVIGLGVTTLILSGYAACLLVNQIIFERHHNRVFRCSTHRITV